MSDAASVVAAPGLVRSGPDGVTDWDRAFTALTRRKARFVLAAAVFVLVFSLGQPVLSVFTTTLDGIAFGPFTWGWVYAVLQFLVPLVVLHLYMWQARKTDDASRALGNLPGANGR